MVTRFISAAMDEARAWHSQPGLERYYRDRRIDHTKTRCWNCGKPGTHKARPQYMECQLCDVSWYAGLDPLPL